MWIQFKIAIYFQYMSFQTKVSHHVQDLPSGIQNVVIVWSEVISIQLLLHIGEGYNSQDYGFCIDQSSVANVMCM